MSTLSKITFGASCILSAVTIVGVYEYQERERAVSSYLIFLFSFFFIFYLLIFKLYNINQKKKINIVFFIILSRPFVWDQFVMLNV